MAGVHQPPGGNDVAPRQRLDEGPHPRVLAHHVSGTSAHQRIGDGREVAQRRESQRADDSLGRGALCNPLGIRRSCERSLLARVDHDDLDLVGGRQGRGGGHQRMAVDQQSMVLNARRGRELVHDPGRHTDGPVLGPLAQQRERERIIGRRAHGKRACDLQRSTRRQARPCGNVRLDGALEAAAGPNFRDHTGHVTSPARREDRGIVHVERHDRRQILDGAREPDDRFVDRVHRHLGPAVDRHG